MNIYNIEIIIFSSSLHPPEAPHKSVPNKKCFQTGMPSFHSNPILFYIPGQTLEQRFTLKPGWTYCWNREINHHAVLWAEPSKPQHQKGPFKGKGLVMLSGY